MLDVVRFHFKYFKVTVRPGDEKWHGGLSWMGMKGKAAAAGVFSCFLGHLVENSSYFSVCDL